MDTERVDAAGLSAFGERVTGKWRGIDGLASGIV